MKHFGEKEEKRIKGVAPVPGIVNPNCNDNIIDANHNVLNVTLTETDNRLG